MIKRLLFTLMILASLGVVSCSNEKEPTKPEEPERPITPTLPTSLAKEWKLLWTQPYSSTDAAWQAKKYSLTDQLVILKMDSTISWGISEDVLYKTWRASGDTLYLAGGTQAEAGFKYVIEGSVLTVTSFDGLLKAQLREKAATAVLDPLLYGSWLLDSIHVYDAKGTLVEDMKANFRQTMNIKPNGEYFTPRIWGLGQDSLVYQWKTDSKIIYITVPEEPILVYDYNVVTRNDKKILYQVEYMFDESDKYIGYQIYKYNEYVLPAIVGRWDLLHILPYNGGRPVGDPEVPDVLFRQYFDAEGGNAVTDLSTGDEFYGSWIIKGDKLILSPEGGDEAIEMRYKIEGDKLYMFAPVPPGAGYDEVANVYVRVK